MAESMDWMFPFGGRGGERGEEEGERRGDRGQ